ncbi:MAG: HNH endonuclease [Myxococcales bacterium]|nr:HNH endonuclease [Myxococcales bacterium]
MKPFAHGGEATPDNLMLACKRHNSHCARLDFGEEYMARFQDWMKPGSGESPGNAATRTAGG